MNIKRLFLTTALFLGIFIFTGEIKTQAQSSCTGGCTYMLTQGSDGQALFSTVQTNKYDYTPGEEVRANLCITNNSSKINLGTTAGGTNGMWKVLLSGGNCVYDRVGYAPANPGTYAANFETTFTSISTPQNKTAWIFSDLLQQPYVCYPTPDDCPPGTYETPGIARLGVRLDSAASENTTYSFTTSAFGSSQTYNVTIMAGQTMGYTGNLTAPIAWGSFPSGGQTYSVSGCNVNPNNLNISLLCSLTVYPTPNTFPW